MKQAQSMNSNHPLEQLRAELAEPEDGYLNPQQYARLSTVEYDSRLHVDFYGKPFDETFHRLSEILRSPEVAIVLASLTLRCPDEGMNGACNWDLGTLLHGDAQFPELRHFSIQQVSPSDHNRIIVASEFEEAGMLGQLLRKSPALDSLITPSAPDASFFEVRDHPLRYLNVDAGFDTQSFIANLAGSPCFPGLKSLEWGEYNETYMDTFPEGCTAFGDYEKLFRSKAFAGLNAFTWRNPVCTPEEIANLRALRPRDTGLQFKIVRTSSDYA
jgi:hypothetical protein